MYVQQGTLDKGVFVYVLNSCGLVKIVKKRYCQISRTQEEIKLVKDNLSRKTCSSYRRVSELVKKLVKENLLVCTRLYFSTVSATVFATTSTTTTVTRTNKPKVPSRQDRAVITSCRSSKNQTDQERLPELTIDINKPITV